MLRRILISIVPGALMGCALDSAVGPNKFAGCYDNSCVDAPQRVPIVPALASMSAMSAHVCGLTPAGDAWCWGANEVGQLGDGTDSTRNAPVKVASDVKFSIISASAYMTCALALDGRVYCWGGGSNGELGQTAPDQCGQYKIACAKAPLALPGSYKSVAAGLRHVCAIDLAGDAWCWGFNHLGETGSTQFGQSVRAPQKVPGPAVYASVVAGDSYTCALSAAGRAFCWGADNRGELGVALEPTCPAPAPFLNSCSASPLAVNTTKTFSTISAANTHVCALTAAGVAYCWGDNGEGQIGTKTYQNTFAPAIAQDGITFSAINASGGATCGTPTGQSSVCWGLNLFGKLGVGTRIELSQQPATIAGGRPFISFAGGLSTICGITSDGAAWCWGSGREGQLGTGAMAP